MTHLHPEVKDFLAAQPLKMCIGGQWTEAASGKTFETLDPGNGKRIASVAAGDATDVDRAVQASREAFQRGGWATMRANDRAVMLHRLADLIDKRKDVIVQIESLDVGKPRGQAAACSGRKHLRIISATNRWFGC
jgi:acyl-CoA reductase-like NAD-dependent aldehyde dehydrogenase